MRMNNVLGLIFSNAYDSAVPELTALRTMGSVPFGGRYRLIDFVLSNMVNCGITKVGVATKSNYQSLMDHLGSGKPWDLSRKTGGIFILPPFSSKDAGGVRNRIEMLHGCMNFLSHSKEEYVILTDCNVVCNTDLGALFDAHTASGADITVAYKRGVKPALTDLMSFAFDGSRITEISVGEPTGGEEAYSLNLFFMRKALLERLIQEAVSLHFDDFERDIIHRNLRTLKICGFEETGFVRTISGLQSFYDANMELLHRENRRQLFTPERPIYTKVRDDMPTIYGLGSEVTNSLIADGCTIEGTVENSILFRGVRVGRGAVVRDCILMQGSMIGENARMGCIVMDKNGVLKPGKTLCGDKTFPIYIGKGIMI
ncbi:MAG: glucose-1-phosphate adenylyltransferase subunit GlgD [Clostridia bacterium]|nr:glucose-1-phosphate adenylyltransferase subunit GlgD [Clostridia bacterium]